MILKEIKLLIYLLHAPATGISSHVEDRLRSYGQEIIEHLEAVWEHSFDAILQERIENLIHKIQFENVKQELNLWLMGGAFDLLQGLIIINKYQYPDLDEQKLINQIEGIKRDIWMQMQYDMNAVEKVKHINHVLYNNYVFSENNM